MLLFGSETRGEKMTTIITEKKFINAVKKVLPIIQKEYFPKWQDALEKDLTYSFLIDPVYTVKNISKDETPKYKLVNLKQLHNVEDYATVDDFMELFSGNKKWNKDYGFLTYHMVMKEDWVNDLLQQLEESLINEGVNSQIEILLKSIEFQKIIVETTDNFWNEWVEKDFKTIIDNNFKTVWEEIKEVSVQIDVSYQEKTQRFNLFQPIAIDWLNFLNTKQANELKSNDVDTLNKLQAWAKVKTYDELELFDEFYPKTSKLRNFKWLDKNLYKEKRDIQNNISNVFTNFFSDNGLVVKKDMVSANIIQLYKLRDDIFSLKKEKVVIIHTQEKTYQFYIDTYNRINGMAEGIVDLMNVLETSLNDVASLIVKQITKETYISEKLSKKGKKEKKYYYNMYGAMLFNGMYRGLPAEEMHDMYTTNHETGEYMGEEEGIKFMEWNVGNWKTPE